MKKIIPLCTLFALLAISFASCSGDDDDKQLTPANAVSGLTFTDTDLAEGTIGGTLSWTLPNPETNIDEYVVYISETATDRQTKLGTVAKGTTSFTVENGTAYNAYLLVIASNATGESTNIASVAITDQKEEYVAQFRGLYILNAGNWGENNASLSYLDASTGKITKDLYKTANGNGLGDTAEQLLAYGGKIYITVTGSNRLVVLDSNHKLLQAIEPKNDKAEPLSPRCLAADNGKVYVSYYDGNVVASLDTSTLAIVDTVSVGSFPEQLAVSNGKIYVANSGQGTGNTVSVIDQSTFKVEKEIEVVANPTQIVADSQGDIYVASWGNYADIKGSLQRINGQTNEVTEMGKGYKMYLDSDTLYMMYAMYGDTEVSYKTYDAKTEQVISDSFITDGTSIESPNAITVDPLSGDIYITDFTYGNTGTLYRFNAAGKLQEKVDTEGYDSKWIVPVIY